MTRLYWISINAGQALFAGVWTGLWVSTALLIMVLTRDRRIPLAMARRIWAPGLIWCAGAKLDIRDTIYHGTPLGWAIYGGQSEIEKYLRARGAK